MQKGFASKNQLLQKVKSSKLVLGISYTKGAKGSNQNSFSVKVGILSWGGGVWPNPNFFQNWPKLNLPWYMAINVMKHTIHKWGGNILWIHEVIGPSNLSSQHFFLLLFGNPNVQAGWDKVPTLTENEFWLLPKDDQLSRLNILTLSILWNLKGFFWIIILNILKFFCHYNFSKLEFLWIFWHSFDVIISLN